MSDRMATSPQPQHLISPRYSTRQTEPSHEFLPGSVNGADSPDPLKSVPISSVLNAYPLVVRADVLEALCEQNPGIVESVLALLKEKAGTSGEKAPGGEPQMGVVVMFSSTGCRHCTSAKHLLSRKGVEFHDINLDDFPKRRPEMMARTGRKTVPQIFLNDLHVGGNEELQALQAEGKLDEMLQACLAAPRSPFAPLLPDEAAAERAEVKREREEEEEGSRKSTRAAGKEGSKTSEEKSGGDGGGSKGGEEGKVAEAHLLELVAQLRAPGSGLSIKNRRYRLRTYACCFVGSEFVSWLCSHRGMGRAEAVGVGSHMVRRKLIHHVCFSQPFRDGMFYYRFQLDEAPHSLNMHRIHTRSSGSSASAVARSLRRQMVGLHTQFLSDDGHAVDYDAVSRSPLFSEYMKNTTALQSLVLGELNGDEIKSFFINLYNALVIHGTVMHGTPNTARERSKFFRTTRYTIGESAYSLDDMEHGILRGNRKPPYKLKRLFAPDDPRARHSVPVVDPRIHFALVCGAKSCPPIMLYSPENLEEALTLATQNFLSDSDNFSVDEGKGVVTLSKLLYWYRGDFGSSDSEVLAFLSRYVEPEQAEAVQRMLARGQCSLKYSAYNWQSNAAPITSEQAKRRN